jgi:ABC-type transport system involved in Fe-S cluster assembly fused permease/ATPase subunit
MHLSLWGVLQRATIHAFARFMAHDHRRTAAPPSQSRSHDPEAKRPSEWRTAGMLLPYLWEFRVRVAIALSFLIVAKLANVAVPLVLKDVVDKLDSSSALLVLPLALLAAYGLLRFSTTLFAELRDIVFVRVTQRAVRRVALGVFRHMHSLSLRFHLERQTGGVSRDIERGTRGISTLLSYMLFSIIPVVLEFGLVAAILLAKFDWRFAAVTFGAVAVYIGFTVTVTEWRIHIRRQANELDSSANTRAVDSLLNYETVKYFNNEEFEARRYDENLQKYEAAAVKNEASLGVLNIGQSFIIAIAVTLLMVLAAQGVVNRSLTLGDLVLVNALLIQLYIPLNFLGMVYREIKQSLVDMDRMFGLLSEHREIRDRPGAVPFSATEASLRFEQVDFSYEPRRQILYAVSFDLPAGSKVAVVGPSGSGKSTLARLLFRFYDVNDGRISLNGNDLRDFTQASVRAAIGIVPQDTVLFNDTVLYNIHYGRPGASREEVLEAAKSAHIHDFIESLPDKYETRVGERGLKLSGGEKQRVAIARAILKNPRILIFDEATSALDSETEKGIQAELDRIARGRTTLVIAHRLSTIMDADQILVMEQGRIMERGTHRALLAEGGMYAQMWALQQQEEKEQDVDPAKNYSAIDGAQLVR